MKIKNYRRTYAQNENASDDLYSMFSDFADEMGEEEKKEKAK